MLFNSIEFAIFFPIVFILYWFVTHKDYKKQNFLLIAASYYFYACWDWRFSFLLLFSTILCYWTGLAIFRSETKKKRKFWLWFSVAVNVGVLGFFKYFNFFIESFSDFLGVVGLQANLSTLSIVLPVGISFYTFHGLSYVIDIYKDRIQPERNVVNYALFVGYFPLLVAGPIERATHLLPQLIKERKFDYSKSVDGLRQILWGLFKKIVIADNCATVVNQIFSNYQNEPASNLFLGGVLFAFQIYGDFSGYTDIALGTSRLLGIELLQNFKYPYFARDIAEFWRRWHISLTTWFRDYIYIPLGGSREGKLKSIRNTFIIFLISGFWHGANWTFILWGFYHALLFLPLLVLGKNRKNTNTIAEGKFLPNFKEIGQLLLTFILVLIGWIIFRAPSIQIAFDYIGGLFSKSLFKLPSYSINTLILMTVIMLGMEWLQRMRLHGLEHLELLLKYSWMRWIVYFFIVFSIIQFGGKAETFIYFQF